MNGQVVNLRQARKSRARREKRADADASAARHGRTRTEAAREEDAARKAARHLDGHERQ